MSGRPIDALYHVCAGGIGVEAWTPDRLGRLRAALRAIVDAPGAAAGGPVDPGGGRENAAFLLIAAARCLLVEGPDPATSAAVAVAVRVWHRRPERPPAPAPAPYWKRGDLA